MLEGMSRLVFEGHCCAWQYESFLNKYKNITIIENIEKFVPLVLTFAFLHLIYITFADEPRAALAPENAFLAHFTVPEDRCGARTFLYFYYTFIPHSSTFILFGAFFLLFSTFYN